MCIRKPDVSKSMTCNYYDDECFLNVEKDLVTRGCAKEQNIDTPIDFNVKCIIGDLCETCSSEDNCNNKLVDGEFCLSCDSINDSNCRYKANYTMRIQCPLALKTLGCYLYEDDDSVKRGCLSSISQFERNVCRNEDSHCKICFGSDCNAKESFTKCRICSSKNTVNCIRSAGSVPTKICKDYMDECFVHVVNNVVTRGCLNEQILHPINYRKDCENQDICEKCSNHNYCNNKIIDGEFCFECNSSIDQNCLKNVSIVMRKQCPLAVKKQGCFRFEDEGGQLVKRGCLSNVTYYEISFCRQEGLNCKTCFGNDCNSKVAFQSCRTCDSRNDVTCIDDPNESRSQLCKDYKDECFTHVDNDVVIRGCLKGLNKTHVINNETLPEIDFIKDCKSSDLCQKCSNKANCNNAILNREFCLTCDSSTDRNCRFNVSYDLRTQCPLAVKPIGCYRFEEKGIVKRGCIKHISRQEIEICRQEGEKCKTCIGNDCNSKILFQKCRVCNSINTVNCIRYPKAVPSIICKSYIDECIVHVDGDIVTRGCLQEISQNTTVDYQGDCANPDLCERCSNNADCNDQKIDGEFCYVCDSTHNRKCKQNISVDMRKQCPLAARRVGCFRFEDNGGETVKRGCLSNITHHEIRECRINDKNCKVCLGDDCNAKIGFQRCRYCNSKESINCIRGPSGVQTKLCREYLDGCYVRVKGDEIRRGCLSELSIELRNECKSKDVCEICSNRDNCNNKVIEGEFCITCDSTMNLDCKNKTSISMRKQCPLAVIQIGCYRFENGGIIKRGCVISLTKIEQDVCRREGAICKTCNGNDCNTKLNFQKCRICNSTENVDCVRAASMVSTVTCKTYLDQCFTHVVGDVITRGCLLDKTVDDIIDYKKVCDITDACELCIDKENCNEKIVDGEFCLACDSTIDPKCRSNVSFAMRKQCPLSVKPLGCYRFEDEGGKIVKRGCLSNLTEYEMHMCRFNDTTCKICFGNDCNSKIHFEKCLHCYSETESNCLIEPTLIRNKTCRNYLDQCYTYYENNVIQRGCLSEANAVLKKKCLEQEPTCQLCIGDPNTACNTIQVGKDRCLVCDSRSDPNCTGNVNITISQECGATARAAVGCYLSKKNNIVQRGCLGNLDKEDQQNCINNSINCKTCQGHNCNRKPEFQSCFECNSSHYDGCVNGVDSMPIVTCRDYGDICAVKIDQYGITHRGCKNDLPKDTYKEKTQACVENKCNNNIFPENRLRCNQCDTSSSCKDVGVTNSTIQICQTYSKSDRCYTVVVKGNYQ